MLLRGECKDRLRTFIWFHKDYRERQRKRAWCLWKDEYKIQRVDLWSTELGSGWAVAFNWEFLLFQKIHSDDLETQFNRQNKAYLIKYDIFWPCSIKSTLNVVHKVFSNSTLKHLASIIEHICKLPCTLDFFSLLHTSLLSVLFPRSAHKHSFHQS